jgi:xanthine dehydrogenase iron-sulfur cluster and FAD-binding subunit A
MHLARSHDAPLISKYNASTDEVTEFPASSCLTFLCSVDHCSVTTTEGISNTEDGYHPVQQRPSGFHGTPCMCMCICGRPFVLAPAVGCRRSAAVESGLPLVDCLA